MVPELGGTDQILGVVMLDFRFGVSNCNASELVVFLRSFANDLTVKQLILSQSF